jgi:DNA polymerase III epsilon subunit-like protein
MIRTFLSIDTETTGLDHHLNAIVSLSGQVGKYDTIEKTLIIDKVFHFKIRPFDGAVIEDAALSINGFTREDFETDEFLTYDRVHRKLLVMLSDYNNKFKKWDGRMFWLGYNYKFDLDFVDSLFKRCGKERLVEYTNFYPLDPFQMSSQRAFLSSDTTSIETPNLKLETLCNKEGIKLYAHNSLSDSLATLAYFAKLNGLSVQIADQLFSDDGLNILEPSVTELIEQGKIKVYK